MSVEPAMIDDDFLDTEGIDELPGMQAFDNTRLLQKIAVLERKLQDRETATEVLVREAKERAKREQQRELDAKTLEISTLKENARCDVAIVEELEDQIANLCGLDEAAGKKASRYISTLEGRLGAEEMRWIKYLKALQFFAGLVNTGRVEGLSVTEGNVVRCIKDWISCPPLPTSKDVQRMVSVEDYPPEAYLVNLFDVDEMKVGAGRAPKPHDAVPLEAYALRGDVTKYSSSGDIPPTDPSWDDNVPF